MARITGKFGSLYLAGSGTKIADLINWTFEPRTDILPCGIKMDFNEISVAGHASARITPERIPNLAGILFAYSQDHAVNGNPVPFVLDQAADVTGTTRITDKGFAEPDR